MRKTTIFPAMALSLLTLGTVTAALPASAATTHHAVRAAGEDTGDGSTPATVPSSSGSSGSSSGGSSTPSGGASTGGGGMADLGNHGATNAAPWLATGGVGLALLGAATAARRRRALNA
jgi:MYXO-CTERM domain-containing protein